MAFKISGSNFSLQQQPLEIFFTFFTVHLFHFFKLQALHSHMVCESSTQIYLNINLAFYLCQKVKNMQNVELAYIWERYESLSLSLPCNGLKIMVYWVAIMGQL